MSKETTFKSGITNHTLGHLFHFMKVYPVAINLLLNVCVLSCTSKHQPIKLECWSWCDVPVLPLSQMTVSVWSLKGWLWDISKMIPTFSIKLDTEDKARDLYKEAIRLGLCVWCEFSNQTTTPTAVVLPSLLWYESSNCMAVTMFACSISSQIIEELTKNGVEIYRFPTDDETVAEMNNTMNVSTTLSVFQSTGTQLVAAPLVVTLLTT